MYIQWCGFAEAKKGKSNISWPSYILCPKHTTLKMFKRKSYFQAHKNRLWYCEQLSITFSSKLFLSLNLVPVVILRPRKSYYFLTRTFLSSGNVLKSNRKFFSLNIVKDLLKFSFVYNHFYYSNSSWHSHKDSYFVQVTAQSQKNMPNVFSMLLYNRNFKQVTWRPLVRNGLTD